MANAAEMRKLALELPDVEEKSRFEQPDFRVRNRVDGVCPRSARRW
jgi:hypothetical protein